MTRLILLAPVWLLAVGAAPAAERPSRSRLCPGDLPEGVRLPAPPGCDAPSVKPTTPRHGIYDLGDGNTVQIGGRVGATFGARR